MQDGIYIKTNTIQLLTNGNGSTNLPAVLVYSQISFRSSPKFTGSQRIGGYVIANYSDFYFLGLTYKQIKTALTFLEAKGLIKRKIFHQNLKGVKGTYLGLSITTVPPGTEGESLQVRRVGTSRDGGSVPPGTNKVKESKEVLKSSSNSTTTPNPDFLKVEETFKISAEKYSRTLRRGFSKNIDKLNPFLKKHGLPIILKMIDYYLRNPLDNSKFDHAQPSVDSFVQYFPEIYKECISRHSGQYSEDAMTFHNMR